MRQIIEDLFQDDLGVSNGNDKPYPFIDHSNSDECLNWLNQDINSKIRSKQTRIEVIRRLEALFKGISTTEYKRRDQEIDNGFKVPKVMVNFINEMVEAKVAQRSRFKPAIAVIPNSVDTKDEIRAEASKYLLTAKAQELDFETLFADGDKANFMRGESFTYIKWNKYGGQPDKAALSTGLTYEDGTPVEVLNVGEVELKVLGPEKVFPQMGKKDWNNVDDISVIDFVHIEELKHDYPQVESKITESGSEYSWILSEEEKQFLGQYAMVVEYYHKPTRHLPKGAYVKYVNGTILEKTEYPYSHGKLPFIFDTDITVPGEMVGRPFIANIERLQRLHDMVTTSYARGFAISNSPKWVYPKGAVDQDKLTNSYSALEYNGPMAPQLVAFNGINPNSIQAMDWIEGAIQKGASVYGISRGEPPAGVKAAVALQFLDEQEMQRESRGMAKRQKRIIDVNKMVLSVMQQYYKPTDGRIIKMLGEDNVYMIKPFESMEVYGEFDIRIQNSSALPDTKTAKIAAILDLNTATQADPMFKPADIADLLDLGNDKRYKTQALSGQKAAQFKLQQIIEGTAQPQPRQFDDFLAEYPIFTAALRQREYKGEDPTIMDALQQYIMGMEFLMWKKAQLNESFKMRVMMMPDFPMFYEVPLNPPMMGAPMSAPGPINTDAVKNTNNQALQDQQMVTGEQGV